MQWKLKHKNKYFNFRLFPHDIHHFRYVVEVLLADGKIHISAKDSETEIKNSFLTHLLLQMEPCHMEMPSSHRGHWRHSWGCVSAQSDQVIRRPLSMFIGYYDIISINVRKRTFRHAPSDESDQTVHSHWSESSLCAFWIAKIAKFLHSDKEDSDQTARTRMLIWV